MFDDANGFVVCYGLAVPEKIEACILGDNLWLVDKRLNKFKDDEIMKNKGNEFFLGWVCFKEIRNVSIYKRK